MARRRLFLHFVVPPSALAAACRSTKVAWLATIALVAVGKKASGTIATCYLENSQRVTLIWVRVSQHTNTGGAGERSVVVLGFELNWLHLRVHSGSMLRCVGKVAEAARMW